MPSTDALVTEHVSLLATTKETGHSGVTVLQLSDDKYRVTFTMRDAPRGYGAVLSLLVALHLNIVEAHGYTKESLGDGQFHGCALNSFVVDAWTGTGGQAGLAHLLESRLSALDAALQGKQGVAAAAGEVTEDEPPGEVVGAVAASSGDDDWRVDPSQLAFLECVGMGVTGKVYRGTYRGHEVAIKVVKYTSHQDEQVRDFIQELNILRKVRHRNIVQLIGASTVAPKLCIVTEYMSGGSLAHFLAKNPALHIAVQVKLALDIARGMDYLHRCGIIHRDLKAANLLMNEHGDCSVADFGVARVVDSASIMTAETGTYRWMAPEVVSHQPYDAKCDVYSFGIVLWEIATGGAVPYAGLTPLQAAVSVVQKGLRPTIPVTCLPAVSSFMHACWHGEPDKRPSFNDLVLQLEALHTQLAAARNHAAAGEKPGIMEKIRREFLRRH